MATSQLQLLRCFRIGSYSNSCSTTFSIFPFAPRFRRNLNFRSTVVRPMIIAAAAIATAATAAIIYYSFLNIVSASVSHLSSVRCPLLFVEGASQFPGLPLPIDSVFVCCLDHTILPRDKYVFTKGKNIYIYDAVMQEAQFLHNTSVHWLPPFGSGLLLFNDSHSEAFGTFDASTWWTNGRNYYFKGSDYLRWMPATNLGASRISSIESGWPQLNDVSNMNGWLTVNQQWSYIFKNSSVYRYNNDLDMADDSDTWPRSVADVFSDDFPADIDDIDVDPNRHVWQIFKGSDTYLYSPKQRRVLPGWPKPIHSDDADGGTNGMGRTRCSGITELSTTIGFIEDKSPLQSLRSLPYALNLSCSWVISVPSRLLQQNIFSGISWRFDRFDLGNGAMIQIEELMDKPDADDIVRTDWNYFPADLFSSAWLTQGSDDEVLPLLNTKPKLLQTYTNTNPPNINPIVIDTSSSNSMQLRVNFTTSVDVGHIGTGFSLRFAMATPVQRTFTTLDGIFWFTSLGLAGTQSIVINPTTLTNPRIAFSLRFQQYPLWEINYNQLVVTAFSGKDNSTIKVCTGQSLYSSSVDSPRCEFPTEAGHTPITLVFSAPTGDFVSTVQGEYSAQTICDSSRDTPIVITAVSGVISDGSGDNHYYRARSNCHWRIEAPPEYAHEVIFITFNFSKLVLFPNAVQHPTYINLTANAYAGRVSDREDGIKETTSNIYDVDWGVIDFFDAHNVWIRDVTVYDGTGTPGEFTKKTLPVVAGHGSRMSMYFRAGLSMAEGFKGHFKMHFPPIIESINISELDQLNTHEVTDHLARIGSAASGLIWAGDQQSIGVHAKDVLNDEVEWVFPGAFQTILRLIPTTLTNRLSADQMQALSSFPRSIYDVGYWHSINETSFTTELLSQVLEVMDDAGSMRFIAPNKSGDYSLQVVFVLRADSSILSPKLGWGNCSVFEKDAFVVNIHSSIIHVAPKIASHSDSTAMRPTGFIDASAISASTSLDPTRGTDDTAVLETINALKLLAPITYNVSMNDGAAGLNGNYTAGFTFQLLVFTRDRFGNLMEGFVTDDLRVFFVSDSFSSKLRMMQLVPGIYLFTFMPIVAAKYVLTVLVGGNDISEGPFAPTILPDVTNAAKSSLIVESTKYSVLATPLPLNQLLTLVLNAKDKYSNPQLLSIGQTDTVDFEWMDHAVALVSHIGNEWKFQVRTGSQYETSIMKVLINQKPVAYDPTSPFTLAYAVGLPVSVGVPVVINRSLPDALFNAFTWITALLMIFTMTCMYGVYIYWSAPIVKAGSPVFLLFMLLGSLLEYASVIPMMIPNLDEVSCAITPLLGHMGFIAIFGSLFVKTQRLKAIFEMKKLQVIAMSDSSLFLRLMSLQILFILYYVVWMIVARPVPVQIDMDLDRYTVCASALSYAALLPLAFDALLIVYGIWLTSRIWGLPSYFNESKYLFASIYSVSVVGVLVLVLVKFVLTNPHVQLIFTAAGVLFATTFVICCMVIPKLHAAYLAKSKLKSLSRSSTAKGLDLITHVPSHRPPSVLHGAEARGLATGEPVAVPSPIGMGSNSNPNNHLTATGIHARIASGGRIMSQIGDSDEAAIGLPSPQVGERKDSRFLASPRNAF